MDTILDVPENIAKRFILYLIIVFLKISKVFKYKILYQSLDVLSIINLIVLKHLSNTKNIKKIRKYIYLYYTLEYASEVVGRENENKYYSADESLFIYDVNDQQIWLFGLINNNS